MKAHFVTEMTKLLQLGIAVNLVFWWCFCRDAKCFAGPGAKIQVFAALTAKGTKQVGRVIEAVASARVARDHAGFAG